MKHATRNLPLSFLLVVAATTVAISRYMVVAGATEHYAISGDLWNWVNITCGAAMAILEGVSVWYCWRAWSAAKPCAERNVLLILIATTVVSLYGSIMPTIVAGATAQPFEAVVAGGWVFVWATCVTVAPFAIMSANAIAGTLSQVAVDNVAMQPVDNHVAFVNVIDNHVAPVVAQVDNHVAPVDNVVESLTVKVAPLDNAIVEVAPKVAVEVAQPSQLATPKLIDLLRVDATMSNADLAVALGVSRQAVGAQLRKLEEAGSIRRNGHIEVV